MLTGLSVTPTSMREDWRPTLQRAVASHRESRVVAAHPSPSGAVPSQLVASTAAAAEVMVAILAVAEVASEVTLAAPPPLAMAKEERDTGFPASPGGGPHGSPSRSELEVPGGNAAGPKPKCLPVAHEIEVVEIPSDGEVGDEVEPPAPSQELVMVRSLAGPSS